MILTTNELVDRTRNFKSNASWFKQQKYGKNAPQARFFVKRCIAGQNFGRSPNGYSVLFIQYIIYFSQITAQNLLLLINS